MPSKNQDKLNSVAAKGVANAAFRVIDALQDLPPHVIAPAVAATLLIISERAKADPRTVLNVAERVLSNEAYHTEPEFIALRNYAKGEL